MKKKRKSPSELIAKTDRLTDLDRIEIEKICYKEAGEKGKAFYTTPKFISFKDFCRYMHVNCRINENSWWFSEILRGYKSKFESE